jgi:DNA (cytosine-5)-methyltransferase 1
METTLTSLAAPAGPQLIDRINELLRLTYRDADLGNLENPLDEAIYILLSKQTSQVLYQRAYRDLRAAWPRWADVLDADPAMVADVLQPSGLSLQRAQHIQQLLAAVKDMCKQRGLRTLTLNWLHTMPDRKVETLLASLPGLSIKSARCVMHYSLGRDVFAVDTHIRRILDRLEIVEDPHPTRKVDHTRYDDKIPARYRRSLHVNLIHHGRALCTPRKPACSSCPLISFCKPGQNRAAELHNEVPEPERKPVAVELFAGGGGLGEGFTRAGFDVAVAVELDRAAAQTYRLNHPGTVVLETDAMNVTAADIAAVAPRATQPAALIAGPPCQGYSVAGKRDAGDTKNTLYRAVISLARQLRPRYVAIENVPGVRKVDGRSFEAAILDELTGAGYHAGAHLLRACDYGVPQLRRRILFLGQRADKGPAPESPSATHCAGTKCASGCGSQPGSKCSNPPTPSVLQTLKQIPWLEAGLDAEHMVIAGVTIYNGSTMDHSAAVIEKISKITPGAGPISYRRLHPDLARTIVAGHRALPVHPVMHRTLSVREAALIQGFDLSHVFCGTRSQQPLQVANAVPPPMAEAVALAILREAVPAQPAGEHKTAEQIPA